ncbi:MAG: porin [Bacteroidetes bacterium]|nr:porin [Bacteroidota bacterium]
MLKTQKFSLRKTSCIFAFVALFLTNSGSLFAQTDGDDSTTTVVIDPAIDSVNNKVDNLRGDFEVLKHLKLTGHVLAQYQIAQAPGIPSFEGGAFAPGVDKRFMVRETRLKTTYEDGLSKFVAEIDIQERSAVALKDAYARFTDPFIRSFSFQIGSFYRPFGYEISASSSTRETPDRSRFIQTIFPGERDLGAMVTFQPNKESRFNWFKIEGGMFNGTGTTVADYDYQKDFIGNMHITKSLMNERLKVSFGGSYYNGGVRTFGKTVYDKITTDVSGKKVWDSTAVASNNPIVRKEIYGADAQITIDWLIGLTTFRGEYMNGWEPGTAATSVHSATQLPGNLYNRNFDAAYFYWVQNILDTRHQLVVRYDWYDPNLKLSNTDLTSATKFTNADVKYTTMGAGYIFKFDEHTKITAYYSMVQNEKVTLKGFTTGTGTDIRGIDLKDDVFTLRVTYKF